MSVCKSNDPYVKKLWELWRLSGWSIADLATKAGVETSTINTWFNNRNAPSMVAYTACINALGHDISISPTGELERLKRMELLYAEMNISRLLELKEKVKELSCLI